MPRRAADAARGDGAVGDDAARRQSNGSICGRRSVSEGAVGHGAEEAMRLARACGGPLIATVIGLSAAAAAAQPVPSHDVAGGLDALNRLCRSTIETRNYDEAQRICKRISFDAEKMAPGSQAHVTSLINMGDIKARVENY